MRVIGDIENSMVIDKHWRHLEQPEPKAIDECLGCLEDIYAGEDVYEFTSLTGETVLVHQNAECCQQYVGAISYCKVAGE